MAKSTTGSTGLAQQPAGTGSTTTTHSEDPIGEARDQAGDSIGHIATRATDLGFRQADTRREDVARGLHSFAGTIRRASSDMQGEQPAVAGIAQTAADQTDRLATFLRDTDAREIVNGVEDMARRQPLLFLGGAFVLGFAASRLLKAGTGGDQGVSPAYRSGNGTRYDAGVGSAYRATGPGTARSTGEPVSGEVL